MVLGLSEFKFLTDAPSSTTKDTPFEKDNETNPINKLSNQSIISYEVVKKLDKSRIVTVFSIQYSNDFEYFFENTKIKGFPSVSSCASITNSVGMDFDSDTHSSCSNTPGGDSEFENDLPSSPPSIAPSPARQTSSQTSSEYNDYPNTESIQEDSHEIKLSMNVIKYNGQFQETSMHRIHRYLLIKRGTIIHASASLDHTVSVFTLFNESRYETVLMHGKTSMKRLYKSRHPHTISFIKEVPNETKKSIQYSLLLVEQKKYPLYCLSYGNLVLHKPSAKRSFFKSSKQQHLKVIKPDLESFHTITKSAITYEYNTTVPNQQVAGNLFYIRYRRGIYMVCLSQYHRSSRKFNLVYRKLLSSPLSKSLPLKSSFKKLLRLNQAQTYFIHLSSTMDVMVILIHFHENFKLKTQIRFAIINRDITFETINVDGWHYGIRSELYPFSTIRPSKANILFIPLKMNLFGVYIQSKNRFILFDFDSHHHGLQKLYDGELPLSVLPMHQILDKDSLILQHHGTMLVASSKDTGINKIIQFKIQKPAIFEWVHEGLLTAHHGLHILSSHFKDQVNADIMMQNICNDIYYQRDDNNKIKVRKDFLL